MKGASMPMNNLIRQMRRSALLRDGAGQPDGQLLERFVASQDELAFEALLRRHGRMVLGVCRRVLGNPHDAEDAFQATFIVLVRKAASVRRHESVGSWLYGVAYRTALEAKGRLARRRVRERQVRDMPEPTAEPEAELRELLPVLDRELSHLPERLRSAVVLCDLEGKTRGEAARLLGVPEGTLSGRLTTARRLLAKRLARYGPAFAGAALATALAQNTASACLPTPLIVSTTKAATLVVAGNAAAAGKVAALAEGVMKTMFLSKLKLTFGVAFVAVALGAAGLVYQAGGGAGTAQAAGPGDKPPTELEALRKENELLKLNLQVVLENVRAQESELHTLRGQVKAAPTDLGVGVADYNKDGSIDFYIQRSVTTTAPQVPDPAQEAEAAIKALREAKDPQAKRHAAEALEKAVTKLKEQLK
jgi:RNA polymerase sigma factor (sigma-70 family)